MVMVVIWMGCLLCCVFDVQGFSGMLLDCVMMVLVG